MSVRLYSCPRCGEGLRLDEKLNVYLCTGCYRKWCKRHIKKLHDGGVIRGP